MRTKKKILGIFSVVLIEEEIVNFSDLLVDDDLEKVLDFGKEELKKGSVSNSVIFMLIVILLLDGMKDIINSIGGIFHKVGFSNSLIRSM